jgi:hypothetical protein
MMLRRVRKEEVPSDMQTKPDGLDYCLDCWKAWMHGDADKDLGAKTMAGLVSDSDGYGVNVYEAQQIADARIAIATDAMIDSLKTIHSWAVYRMCSIATPWKYPNADFIVVAQEARIELERKLKKNVCTAILF